MVIDCRITTLYFTEYFNSIGGKKWKYIYTSRIRFHWLISSHKTRPFFLKTIHFVRIYTNITQSRMHINKQTRSHFNKMEIIVPMSLWMLLMQLKIGDKNLLNGIFSLGSKMTVWIFRVFRVNAPRKESHHQ